VHNPDTALCIQSDTKSTKTKLHVASSVRGDSGKYTIEATNEFGTDKADFEVIVVDKPGPPGGPIVPTKITGDSVTLTWKPVEGKLEEHMCGSGSVIAVKIMMFYYYFLICLCQQMTVALKSMVSES